MSFAFSLKASTKRKSILSASGSSSSAASALLGGCDDGEEEEGRAEAVKAISSGGVVEVTEGERALAAAKKLVIPLVAVAEQDTHAASRGIPMTSIPVHADAASEHDGGSAPAPSKRPNRLLLSKVDPTMDDAKRFKNDVMNSAADISTHSDAYRAVPVEAFGAALLRGMGWREEEEGGGQGKSSLLDAPIVPREKGLGLGATARPPSADGVPAKRLTHPKYYAAAKAAASSGKQARASEWQQRAEQRVREQVLAIGDAVWLRAASLAGRRARVVGAEAGAPFVEVCLEGADGQQVRVRREEVVLLSAEELAPALHGSTSLAEEVKVEVEIAEGRDNGWFHEGVRVRITSKKLDSGECVAYLQKGTVLSLGTDGRAAVRLDSGFVLHGVSCRRAETVPPREVGAACMVVAGPQRGTRGALVARDKAGGTLDVLPLAGEVLRGLALDDVAALQQE